MPKKIHPRCCICQRISHLWDLDSCPPHISSLRNGSMGLQYCQGPPISSPSILYIQSTIRHSPIVPNVTQETLHGMGGQALVHEKYTDFMRRRWRSVFSYAARHVREERQKAEVAFVMPQRTLYSGKTMSIGRSHVSLFFVLRILCNKLTSLLRRDPSFLQKMCNDARLA